MKAQIGIKYEKKPNDLYVIDFIELDDANMSSTNDKNVMIVCSTFRDAIKKHNIDGRVYNIGYAKFIDLVNKHATNKLPAMSIPMDEKQYILNYIDEKLPETFYYRDLIIEFAEKMHNAYDGNRKNIGIYIDGEFTNEKLKNFLNSLLHQNIIEKTSKSGSNYMARYGDICMTYTGYTYNNRYAMVHNDKLGYSRTSINMGLRSMVDDCVRFLNE